MFLFPKVCIISSSNYIQSSQVQEKEILHCCSVLETFKSVRMLLEASRKSAWARKDTVSSASRIKASTDAQFAKNLHEAETPPGDIFRKKPSEHPIHRLHRHQHRLHNDHLERRIRTLEEFQKLIHFRLLFLLGLERLKR